MTDLLRQLLSMPDLSPDLQRRILEQGRLAKDTGLLAALARYPDLAPDVDTALAADTAAPVRSAWLARDTRTEPEILAAVTGDRRAGILAALASRRDLPEEVYRSLPSRLAPAGLAALLANAAAPAEVREDSAARLGAQATMRTFNATILDCLAAHPDLAAVALLATSNPALVAACLRRATPSAKTMAHVVKVVAALPAEDPESATAAAEIMGVLQGCVLTPAQCRTLERALTRIANNQAHWRARHLPAYLSYVRRQSRPRYVTPSAVAAAHSDAEVTEVFSRATGSPVLPLLLAARDNPACSSELFGRLASDHLRYYRDSIDQLYRGLADPEKFASLYGVVRPRDLDTALALLDDPAAGLLAIASHPATSPRSLRDVLGSRYLTESVAAALPVHVFTSSPASLPPVVVAAAARALAALPGDESWQNVMVLGNHFEGSLASLTQVASAV